MGMCEACPNRAMMNLNRSLGNEDEAKRIERAGCNWWWGMEYEQVIAGKPSGLKETVYECGIIHVGSMIKDQGSRVEEACQSIQSWRNEVGVLANSLVNKTPALFDLISTQDQIPSYIDEGGVKLIDS